MLLLTVRCANIAGLQDGRRAPGTAGSAAGTAGTTGSGGSAGGAAGTGASGGSNTAGNGGTAAGAGGIAGAGGAGADAAAGSGGSAYAAAVLADHPVLYYRLGDANPPVAVDSSGNGHNGTYMGVTLGVPGAIAGDPDTAASFDGSGTVQGPNLFGFDPNKAFSVEAWVKREDSTNTDDGILGKVQFDQTTNTYLGWFLYSTPTSTTFRRVLNVTGPGVAQNAFTYVVATYDTVNATLYINGKQVATRVISDPVGAHSLPFTIGAFDNWAGFVGVIDEVAIYDYALPASRVLVHYKIGKGLP